MISVADARLVRGLQERAARALPAEHVERLGGWWLRLAPDCSWWVGTVLPHGETGPQRSEGLEAGVKEAEDFYARHGLDTRFQITPRACPDGLDAFLAKRGYHRGGRVSLQAATVARVLERSGEQVPAAPVLGRAREQALVARVLERTRDRAPAEPLRVRVDERPADGWLEGLRAVHGHDGERELLARVEAPSAYASVIAGTEVVAVGRAVADDGWAGVFGMATLPQARGRGASRRVLAALAAWARTRGVDRMYLQVECGNDAAVRLYARAGFEEVCGYHYRTAKAPASR
ncbi:GNAT family N-acetyltransferase [Streptosporangium longisporum]|uniref:GNAT family N-acetyltransferase n=1 Tax=Streptosporangium longisporum TaxID=46187 RepID=A0ABN3XPY8_9ACTN